MVLYVESVIKLRIFHALIPSYAFAEVADKCGSIAHGWDDAIAAYVLRSPAETWLHVGLNIFTLLIISAVATWFVIRRELWTARYAALVMGIAALIYSTREYFPSEYDSNQPCRSVTILGELGTGYKLPLIFHSVSTVLIPLGVFWVITRSRKTNRA